MKQKKPAFKLYGLRARFAISLAASALFCALVFLVLYSLTNMFLANYFEQSGFTEVHIRRQGESLQDFISENGISVKNLEELKRWEYRQPLILLEIYSGGECIYSSFYESPENKIFRYMADYRDEEHSVGIRLADIEASAVLYSDFTYQYYVIGTVVPAIFALVLFILLFLLCNRKLIGYICRLNEEVQILEGGNLEYRIDLKWLRGEERDIAEKINNIGSGLNKAVDEAMRNERLKTDLITNVSHDIKTPLTSMVGYIELIRKEDLSDTVRDYVDVISARAEKLKEMVDSLFSLAKASSGNIELHPEKFELNRMVGQIFADMDDRIRESGLEFVTRLTEDSTELVSDNSYFYRICQNLMENALKYSAKGTRVFVKTYVSHTEKEGRGLEERLCMEITNTSAYPMDFEAEDIVERFARGDKARTGDGNGLGLAIVSTYAKALGGEFEIKIDCDQFKAVVIMPREMKQKESGT